MQLQILSDLHLEIERLGCALGQEVYHYDIPVRADHLALLGDIGWTVEPRLFIWLKDQLKLFKTIFFVSGNHEPYRTSIEQSVARLNEFATEVNADPTIGTFIYLNQSRYDVSATLTVLGCTLWSSLNPSDLDILSWSLTDFRRITAFTTDAYKALHSSDLAWLNATVTSIAKQEPHREIVVLTHHAPTKTGTGDPKYDDQPTNSAFATELTREDCWMPGHVKMWMFGHTHWSCDFEREGIRIYSNQRGYGQGSENYDPGKVVEL